MTVFGEKRVEPRTRPGALRSSIGVYRAGSVLEEAGRANTERKLGSKLGTGAQGWASARALRTGAEGSRDAERLLSANATEPDVPDAESAMGLATGGPDEHPSPGSLALGDADGGSPTRTVAADTAVPPVPRFARTRSGHVVPAPNAVGRPWRGAGTLSLDATIEAHERLERDAHGAGPSRRRRPKTAAPTVGRGGARPESAAGATARASQRPDVPRAVDQLDSMLWEAACARAKGLGEGAVARSRNPSLRKGPSASMAQRRRLAIVSAACSVFDNPELREWRPGARPREDAFAVLVGDAKRPAKVLRDEEAAHELADMLGGRVERRRGAPLVAKKRSQVELGATPRISDVVASDGTWIPADTEGAVAAAAAAGMVAPTGELPTPTLTTQQLRDACGALGVRVSTAEARALMRAMTGSDRGPITVLAFAKRLAGEGAADSARQEVIYGPLPPGGPGAEAAEHARVMYPQCRTAVRAPRGFTAAMAASSSQPPSVKLKLSRALGFGCGAEGAGMALQSGMAYTSVRGEVGYFTAGVGVVADTATGAQRHFTGHSAEITAMAYAPALNVFATGQGSSSGGSTGALVLVWEAPHPGDGRSKQPRVRARLEHPMRTRGVVAIAFSPSGKRLATVGCDSHATLCVWAWASGGTKLFEARCTTGTPPAVRGILWNPAVHDAFSFAGNGGDAGEFVTFGPRHMRCWSPARSAPTKSRMALAKDLSGDSAIGDDGAQRSTSGGYTSMPLSFGDAPMQDVRCACYAPGGRALLTGGAEGALYVWECGRVSYSMAAHCGRRGGIAALASALGGVRVLSCGGDGDVHVWHVTAEPHCKLRHVRTIHDAAGGAALLGLAVQPATGCIALGTARGEVYAACDVTLAADPDSIGDGAGEADSLDYYPTLVSPGLASSGGAVSWCPTEPNVVAVGSQSGGGAGAEQLFLFDAVSGVALRACRLPSGVQSLAWAPAGDRLAVGLVSGGVVVLDPGSSEVVSAYPLRDGRKASSARTTRPAPSASATSVAVLEYSPDGGRLAAVVGSKVIVLDTSEKDQTLATAHGAAGSSVAPAVRLRRAAACSGHGAAVVAVDWSEDGALLATCCKGSEALFFDSRTGEQVACSAVLSRASWAAHTRPLGFEVMGVWPAEGAAPSDWVCSLHASPSRDSVVLAEQHGSLRVSTFPCVALDSPADSYVAHCGRVAGVRFNADGTRVASVGLSDRAVMLWDVENAPLLQQLPRDQASLPAAGSVVPKHV